MARIGRILLPGQPHHLVQRGHDRRAIFFDGDDYVFFKDCLKECSSRYGVSIHAYVLMTNHYHLLASPMDAAAIPAMIQMLGRLYVRYINHGSRRSGTLWEGRYKSSLIDAEDYMFSCMRYIENNPVRAKIVRKPQNYPWSSYARNALDQPDALVQSHALYIDLAKTPKKRADAYCKLFPAIEDAEDVELIRNSLSGGWVVGGENFRERMARKTRQRTAPLPRGGDRRSDKVRSLK